MVVRTSVRGGKGINGAWSENLMEILFYNPMHGRYKNKTCVMKRMMNDGLRVLHKSPLVKLLASRFNNV